MEATTNVEKLYECLDRGTECLQRYLQTPYLDALVAMGENVFHHDVMQQLDKETTDEIREALNELPDESLRSEEVRKAIQLATLKGMRASTQPHHAMTPDAVSLFIGYLVEKMVINKRADNNDEPLFIYDPAVGSANLLTAVLNTISKPAKGKGIDPDETLIQLAYANANLQNHDVNLFHQDSIVTKMDELDDVVICDLPIGYYPNEEVAKNYSLNPGGNEKPYVHHLLIERAIEQTKPGGYGIFLIPNGLFQSDQADQLHEWIKKETMIYGLLQLPQSMFKNQQYAKSIFIVRKRDEYLRDPDQALLAELPSFTNKAAMADMIKQIEDWIDGQIEKDV
ncbi:class I SAM-dependent methyltransferase [Texcoconibacillus texcoconensis]|uniref:Site-specific DNA-methyltransferase (Adenine-specific) n=1 Tax=Texcoconibacillus texcoconensis TaxID=1095777 RepID=A0A840QN13_9BACI|nr:class I SAM-dependent methyltransferase [Texcoconibacillus texcoconensis]MBB5172748.1 site-specific DNA-methyltransferase (adenine-specific) [Texcoconibacillus texcoconensis]